MEWNPVILIRSARQYMAEVRSEFNKVTWPTQKEYVGGTIGVLVIVGIITTALGLTDFGLGRVVQLMVP